MKTSQKDGYITRKVFHLRFFQLNIATGLFKSFTQSGSARKEKGTLDLRNKVVGVIRYGS